MTRSTLIWCILPCALHAQDNSTLDAIIATKRFHVPDQGVQLDLHVSVLGSSAEWKANDHGFQQAHVEALTIIERDTVIVDYRKSDVLGPERADTVKGDFLIEEHFLLQPGEYTLSVELHDMQGKAENRSVWKGPLVIPAKSKGISFSDALLTAGTHPDAQGNQVPAAYTGTYYPPEVDKLGFYMEIYGSDQVFGPDSLFTINYQVESYESHTVKGQFKGVQRAKAAPVVTVGKEFPIGSLPSGNYLLAVETVDREGQVLARQEQFIQRNNPLRYDMNVLNTVDITNTFVDAFTDPDTLAEHIASLRPIAMDLERRMVGDRLKDKDMALMKRFFYTFWVNRDGYDPERAWKKYYEQVVIANRMYGCRNLRGYESDQGIAFLKYGLPSSVVDASLDNEMIPYLIWHYYKAGRFSDKRLVFTQRAMGIGCWALIHSEIPGEIKTPNWQNQLGSPLGDPNQSNDPRPFSIEGERLEDNFLRPH